MSLLCPACKRPLVDVRLEWMHVQVCRSGCKGVWIALRDLSSLNFSEDRMQKILGDAYTAPLRLRPPGMLRCPSCKVAMKPRVHQDTQIQIDVCPACAGVFFDSGELKIIHRVVQLGLHNQIRRRKRQSKTSTVSESTNDVVWVKPGLGTAADVPPLPLAPFSRNLVLQQETADRLLAIGFVLVATKTIHSEDQIWMVDLIQQFFRWLRFPK